MQKPSPNMCLEWLANPVTRWLLEDLEREIKEIGDRTVDGKLIADTEFKTARLAIEASASAQALALVHDTISNISEED
jgi:hypothetical protein